MGKRFILGLTAAVVGGSAFGQFASQRPGSTSPVEPPGLPTTPVAAPAERPTIQASQPAYVTHPLGVKAEYGPVMICVKSYTGPQSQKLAEALAEYVRTSHQAAAYLFEYGGEQRAQEEARQARARQMQIEKNAPFLQAQAEERRKAQAEGRPFIDEPVKYTVPKVTISEQWAVLVGGFPTDEAARRALDVVRKWPPPAERFMDQQFSVGGGQAQGTYINPFAAAMVVPNPAVKKVNGPPPVDPALAKLNSEEPLSLLQTKKSHTLLVKAYNLPATTKSRDEEPGVLGRLFGKGDESAERLQKCAYDARQLAEALRRPEMHRAAQEAAGKIAAQYGQKPFQVPPLAAYVLHTRNGSIVAVGDFDSEDDPALIAAGRILQYMEFEIKYGDGRSERKRMFDNVIPMSIPRPH